MDIPVSYVRQYGDTIDLLYQQMQSVLEGSVFTDMDWKGEAKYQDQISTFSMTEKLTRHQPTTPATPDQRRRKITPRYFTLAILKDPQDALAQKVDPGSVFMQSIGAAGARQKEDIIVSMLGSTCYQLTAAQVDSAITLAAYVGYTGAAGSQIISSSSLGMTKAKLLSARRILNRGYAPKSDRSLALGSDQELDMLNVTEVTSIDYNTVKALVNGDVNQWLGFTFRLTERLLTSGSDRLCYAYHKNSLWLGIQQNPTSRIDVRTDLNMSVQYYMAMCLGGSRLQEAGVVQIACQES